MLKSKSIIATPPGATIKEQLLNSPIPIIKRSMFKSESKFVPFGNWNQNLYIQYFHKLVCQTLALATFFQLGSPIYNHWLTVLAFFPSK